MSFMENNVFKTAAERDLQSVKDNLKEPKTIKQLQQATNMSRPVLIENLKILKKQGLLTKRDSLLVLVEGGADE